MIDEDSLRKWCDVVIECAKGFCAGLDEKEYRTSLCSVVEDLFSANLCVRKCCKEYSDTLLSLCVGDIKSLLVVKNRPGSCEVQAGRRVRLLFEVLETFCGMIVDGKSKSLSCCDVRFSALKARFLELEDLYGARKVLESTFEVVGIIGMEIARIVEHSMLYPQGVHWRCAVDTFETYLCRSILIGAHVTCSTIILEAEKKHVFLLPWWLYLSSCCEIFSVTKESGWSKKMTKNILFFITDCLVRQSFSSRSQCREFLLEISQGLLSGPQILSSHSPDFHPKSLRLETSLSPEFPNYREGHSINVGAEALVGAFFRNFSSSREMPLLSPLQNRDDASSTEVEKSPSPICQGSEWNEGSPLNSVSSLRLVPETSNTSVINPRKMRKLALQFAVKLGNLYATQDVHAMLSFPPRKPSVPTSSRHHVGSSSDEEFSGVSLTEDEKGLSPRRSAQGSSRSPSSSGRERVLEDAMRTTTSMSILREHVFEFLRCSTQLYQGIPISSFYSQHLALFLALFLLSRTFWRGNSPVLSLTNSGRHRRTQEVAFGASVGYTNRLWPQILCDFLDSCTMESICAISMGECHQTYLAKQLVMTVTFFRLRCAESFLPDSWHKKEMDFTSRRWITRCNTLAKELRCSNGEGSCEKSLSLRFQILQHFYLLAFYLFSTLKPNTIWRNSTRRSARFDDEKYLGIPQNDLGAPNWEKEKHQKKILKDVLVEGEDVLQALRRCMNQLPWLNILKTTPERENFKSAAEYVFSSTPGVQQALSPESRVQSKEEAYNKLVRKFQKDIDFLKYCILYYLTIVDLFIEMAVYTSTTPSYLTAILLRSDNHGSCIPSPDSGSSIHNPIHLAEVKAWEGFLNYHCLSIMKDGANLVNMDFISILQHSEENFPSDSMERNFFESLKLDRISDYTPSPEKEFSDSWYFLRILNHAKHVTQYLCSQSAEYDKMVSHSEAGGGNLIKNSFRLDVSRFVDGVTPFLSTSSGVFAQNLSVPHQHPFSSLQKVYENNDNESLLKMSLEEISCDLWLRTQALQLITAASAPISVRVHKNSHLPEERVFILNGSAARTYVRLLFLRIIQAVFSQQGRYDERQENLLLRNVSKESKDLYQLSKRLWVSCLILSLRAIQFLSHNHAKARETAISLGVHGVLSRLIDALSANQQKGSKLSSVDFPGNHSHSVEVQLDDVAMLEESVSSKDGDLSEEVEEPNEENKQLFSSGSIGPGFTSAITIPQLNLDGIPPPMYFVSSGDTGAALQATLFPGVNPNTATVFSLIEQTDNPPSPAIQTPVAKGVHPSLTIPSLDFSVTKQHDSSRPGRNTHQEDVAASSFGLITPSHLYADSYLLSCAVCCTCSLLVHHSGMLRYETTVSAVLLRKRMHLPEASYHLLYGGDSTWKKHVEDTKNSATLKKFLGWCYSDQRPVRPSSVFRTLRRCISNSGDTSFLSLLESWLGENSLTYYRRSLNIFGKKKSGELVPLSNEINDESSKDSSFKRISDDGSLHSIGVFVLLRLLLPRVGWNEQFDIGHRLGAGGFGTVMAGDFHLESSKEESSLGIAPQHLKAEPGWLKEEKKVLADNPAVALKKMPFFQQHDGDSGMLPVCHSEVLAMMCLRGHPYIVPLLSFGSSDDGYFIVLPRYDMGTLYHWRLRQYPSGCAALVQRASPKSSGHDVETPDPTSSKSSLLSLVCPLFTQLLEAVVFMHSQHLRHNDIKAENLLIDEVDTIPSSTASDQNNNRTMGKDVLLPRSIRLCDFGSCDTCTDADIRELLGNLVGGESRFMEGRWGFGNGTEAIQPPEIIVPRWRYELMRTTTLHYVTSQCIPEADKKKSLAANASRGAKSKHEEGADIASLFDTLRRIELSADIWSCGCLLYELLTGVMLFGEGKLGLLTALATSAREKLAEIAKEGQGNVLELFQNATKASPALNHWDTNDLVDAVGQEVVDFLQKLLSVDPLTRPTALKALEKWKVLANRLL